MTGHERERLSAYLDRELPPDERAAVEAHLSACPECAAFLADLAAVDEAAGSLPAEPPEGYFDSFPARVRSRLEPWRVAFPARRVPAWTWAVAAALLLAVVTPLTLRQLRPAPSEAPRVAAALPPSASPGESKPTEDAGRPELPSARPVRPQARAKGAPAPATAAPAPAARLAPAPVPPAAPRETAEADFAREPVPRPPAPAQAAVARDAAAAARVAADNEAGEGLRVAAAESAAQSTAPALSAGRAGAAGGVPEERAPEDAFRRLEAARPRTVDEWRRLRDEWNALAAFAPDPLRADEARVRAIVAGRQAWLSGGSADDEAALRRDVAAYLERTDALQKDRVKRLLPESRQP
jgi:anti-sigma factor RsiW